MAASFTSGGPWQFTPPKDFTGKKEDFEEFAFKLKAYLCIMNPQFGIDLQKIEENGDTDIVEDHFNDSDGNPIDGLRERELQRSSGF